MSFAFPLRSLLTVWLECNTYLLLASRPVFSPIQSEELCCDFRTFRIFAGWKQVVIGAACLAFGARM